MSLNKDDMQKFQLCWILAAVIGCLTILTVSGGPLKDAKDSEKVESCKNLCSHCGCMGFYCGDECICECNNDVEEGESSFAQFRD